MNNNEFNGPNSESSFDEAAERARIRDLFMKRLTDCGWAEIAEEKCGEIIRKKGVKNVSLDEVVYDAMKEGRKSVPDGIKQEIMEQMEQFILRRMVERQRRAQGPSTSRDV
ncbi:hypothetical protein L596_013426 [Steinernema carpocapsae]|uniref:Transcription and mRNA export factor ENY2 n=1 Tax=Steinernema carpocapsae TaxID=34508 RepID=A0A4U5P0L7_STECR|nr:hypothetical protein L596_013426 [Steinernema carpocapsae]